jgi:hypothetical protein
MRASQAGKAVHEGQAAPVGAPAPVAPKGFAAPELIAPVQVADAGNAMASGGRGEEGRPDSERPLEQLLLDTGGILLPRRALQVEAGVEYSHISGNAVAINGYSIFDAIVIGTIRVDDLRRDIVTPSVTMRYGLADRLQFEARVPGVFRRDKEVQGIGTAEISERTTSSLHLGDIETTLSWQPVANNGWIPATILRASSRFPTGRHPFEIDREFVNRGGESRLVTPPTGQGIYSVTPGFNMVWRADPLVYFGGAEYGLNLERNFDGVGDVDPGDAFGWYAGFNFAVSDRVSISTSFVNRHTKKTTVNDIDSIGTSTNDARLIFGTAIANPGGRTLLASAAIGLTDSSPDFSISFSLPFTFRNVGPGLPFLKSADPASLF